MAEQQEDVFPDQHLISHVRDALWRRPSGACVMVGSGFSRNALKVRPDRADIPLWSDLKNDLAGSLPGPDADCDGSGEPRPGSRSNRALELAQQYEDAFGRARLHEFLVRSVRDESFLPAEFHRRLLSLPWRDVFTTNWDTLLERCLPLPERPYGVVTDVDQLPGVAPPRIVKLHGSLPRTFPLIVTADDYDNYPKRFAPFVNTVQQAMMETVFLLLGFSGDDPNFRQWLRWVRENLRDHAPRIYVANWLNLDGRSLHDEFGDENVVPIDLARHPRARDWPEPLKYAKAAEWLLLSLEHGRPYPAEDWPQPTASGRRHVAMHLRPVETIAMKSPREEPWHRVPGKPDNRSELERVRHLLCIWRHNRRCYPHWLALPAERAVQMRGFTDDWQPVILKALPRLQDGLERLGALRELVWRREVQLDPLLLEVAKPVAEVLQEVDCERRLVGGETQNGLGDSDWLRFRRYWRDLAAALVTAARFEFDREAFEQRAERLSAFTSEDEEIAERLHHERCLWALDHQDLPQLEILLEEWEPVAADPAWLLRKGALLAELGEFGEARRLALDVLETVRKWPEETSSLGGRSREAWALSLAHATDPDWDEIVSRLQELQSRFRELARHRCEPWAEVRAHEMAVRGQAEGREYRPFDLGVKNVTGLSFSNEAHYRALAALRAIRLTEIVGSPSVVSGDLLVGCAEALLFCDPEWAAALSMRFSNETAERRFSKTLSRWRVAFMPPELVRGLAEAQHRTIAWALDKLQQGRVKKDGRRIWLDRLEAAVEALSRFVLRLEPSEVERALRLAVTLYRDPRIHSRMNLLRAHRGLMRRSWEALPDAQREAHALSLMSLPIVGVDGFNVDAPDHLPDPGQVLNSDRWASPVPGRATGNEGLWSEIVRLVEAGLRSDGRARERAALRLALLADWKVLTAKEKDRLASALWDFGLDDDRLPLETGLHRWVFLRLPEPAPGMAERRVRATWAPAGSGRAGESVPGEEALASAGVALERLPDFGHPINLTSAERVALERGIERWAESGLSRHMPWQGHQHARKQRHGIRAISALLLELEVSSAATTLLLDRVRELATGKTPAYELLPGIVRSDPAQADKAAALLRVGLGGGVAEQKPQCVSACGGLYLWLRASARSGSEMQAPPGSLIFELGVIIAAHRWLALSNALEVAAWIFENGTREHQDLLRSPCLQGLASLRTALPFREESNPSPLIEPAEVVSDDEVDVPWLRWHCLGLAAAMAGAGLAGESTVTGWLADAENDPLPELRRREGLARSPD